MTTLNQQAITAVNEQTACYVNLAFVDQSGNPYTPSALSYRIDSLTYNQEVQDWTAVSSGLTPTMTLVVSAAQNAKLGSEPSELRRVTWRVTAPGGDSRVDKATYSLQAVPQAELA